MARLSLTKTQQQEGAGAELLVMCQSISEDGRLSVNEINDLRQWLTQNRSSDLPSIEFLCKVVDHIIADGKVTADEEKELYRCLLKVLPPEIREIAASRRRLASAEEKSRAKEETIERRRREQAASEGFEPIDTFDFLIAGVFYEGRDKVVAKYVKAGDQVFLVRDKENKFSRNAVAVCIANGKQIGYVPEEDASSMAPLLDAGALHVARIKKLWQGRRGLIPVVHGDLYDGTSQIEGAVAQSQFNIEKKKPSGCLIWLAILGVAGAAAIWFAFRF